MSWLKRHTWVPVSGIRIAADGKDQPAFITMAALLTFPGAALAVTIVWVVFDRVFKVHSDAVPILAAYVVGFIIWLWGVTAEPKPTPREKWFGLFIAFINSSYILLSVMGIDVGVDALSGVDPVSPRPVGGADGG